MIRRPPRSTPKPSSAASDVYKRQKENGITTEVNVLLHGNCIAWFDTASNDFNISSAGWETVTTKSRLNAILEEFAPERRVFQKNWQWFVSDFLGMAEPFVDGMKI